jgi:isocitrate/isopropylmalate dehydrogenase
MEGFPTRHQKVDFAIIRENTEGEYSGLEHQAVPGVVESLKIMTKAKSERIARFAFDFALKNGRKKVLVFIRCVSFLFILCFLHSFRYFVLLSLSE